MFYNYFKIKEGMFVVMGYDDMFELKILGEVVLVDLLDDLVEGVFVLFKIYLKVFDYISYVMM